MADEKTDVFAFGVVLWELLTQEKPHFGFKSHQVQADARDYWGYAWILAVAQAGVMDADTNYRFRPEREVTRADLADVLVRVRRLSVGHVDPLPAAPRFSDLAPSHLRYPAASEAVALGLLAALEQNTFQPERVVTGAEAMDAVERLSLVLAGAP